MIIVGPRNMTTSVDNFSAKTYRWDDPGTPPLGLCILLVVRGSRLTLRNNYTVNGTVQKTVFGLNGRNVEPFLAGATPSSAEKLVPLAVKVLTLNSVMTVSVVTDMILVKWNDALVFS